MTAAMKRISPLFFFLALPALLGACSAGSAPASDTGASERPGTAQQSGIQVELVKFAFDPDPVRISVGDTITWTNRDDILHTVTSGEAQKQGVPGVSENTDSEPDGLFDQPLELDDEFSFTFEEAGEVSYFCNIHPGMTGTVEVE